jgi:hypothetical protein
MGYPDWCLPIVFVLQEGELWPITEWASHQGLHKHWRVRDTVAAMGYEYTDLYEVPDGSVLYVASAVFSNEDCAEHTLYYTDPAVYIDDMYIFEGAAHRSLYIPPEPLTAGKILSVGIQNSVNNAIGYAVVVRAWEIVL